MSWSATPGYLKKAGKIADLARKVGGYDELVRLERERRDVQSQGKKPLIVIDEQGNYWVIPKPE